MDDVLRMRNTTGLSGFSQNTAFPVPPTAPTPALGSDDFVLARYEAAGARTDFLSIRYQDWALADQLDYFNAVAFFSWRDVTSATLTPAANPSDAWNSPTYIKPTTSLSNVDPPVTSRSNDYRGPSALATLVGTPWISASENTGGGDDFNEAEAAYLLTLDPVQGLKFRIDGSALTPRYQPFFKIRQWRSLAGPPSVTLQGAALVRDVSYRADVMPVKERGVSCEIIDLRTLVPLDKKMIFNTVKKTSKVVILHEQTKTGGVGAEVSALISEYCFDSLDAPIIRVAAPDTPVPYSAQMEEAFLPQPKDVISAVDKLMRY